MTATGIDVSHYQGSIDWARVAGAGVDFAVIKASEGTAGGDSTAPGNAARAAGTGLLVGLYHFAHPAATSAPAEADNFLAHWRSMPAAHTLPPVLDLEAPHRYSPDATVRWVVDWLEHVEQATGARPIIYSSATWLDPLVDHAQPLLEYPLWVAHYTTRPAPNMPRLWTAAGKTWLWWQHTSNGRVAGINGTVDLNRSQLDRSQLAELVHGQEAPDMTETERQMLEMTFNMAKRLCEELLPDANRVDDAELLQAVADLKNTIAAGRG